MAGVLIIPSKFTAIDKFTPVMKRMTAASSSFTTRTRAGFEMVNIAERKATTGLKKLSSKFGKLGQLGLALGGLAVFSHIAAQTVALDKNLHSLQAVTGVNNAQFAKFKEKIDEVSKSQKVFTGDTAKAFEIIASEQPALLKNAKGLATVTDAVMTLSKASGDDLATSAENLTGVMNQFDLKANQAHRTMNVLAAGYVNGSADIGLINESLADFGAVAHASNMTVEESVAAVEILASKNIKGAKAGHLLRAAILNFKKAGVGYKSGVFKMSDALDEFKKKLSTATSEQAKDKLMMDAFGKTGMVAGTILLNNADKYNTLTKKVTGTNDALSMAETNTDTLSMRWKELTAAFDTSTTSIGNSNTGMSLLKGTMVFLANNMNLIIGLITTLIGTFIALKTIMFLVKAATIAYNIVTGISVALQEGNVMALRGSSISMAAYAVTTKVITAATWLWAGAQEVINILLTANPIGLIIMAIAALIAIIVAIIYKYNEWGAALSLVLGPLGLLIDLIMSLKRNWDMIKKAFTTGGILAGIKAIGVAIFDMILMPIQQLLELIGMTETAAKLENFRASIGANVEKVNPDATKESINTSRQEINTNNNLNLNINAPDGLKPELEGNTGNVAVQLTPTF